MCKKIECGNVRFVAGQVWFFVENEAVTTAMRNDGSMVINGSRPYLIIKDNSELGTVTCLPMTSNSEKSWKHELDVIFMNNGMTHPESLVCVSQICTKSCNGFSKYLYSINDEALQEVIKSVKEYLFGDKPHDEFLLDCKSHIKIQEPVNDIPKGRCRHPFVELKTYEQCKEFLDKWDGVPYVTIQEALGISRGTVCSYLTKCRKKVKEYEQT